MKVTVEEIELAKTEKGGWTKETLAQWGVPWPPPKGWKEALIKGEPIPSHREGTLAAAREEMDPATLLRKLVLTLIENDQSHLLALIPEVAEYFGSTMPTVADIVGRDIKLEWLEGGIRMDDKVYRFSCARLSK